MKYFASASTLVDDATTMELDDLRVFLAVVERGSLLAAAESLGLARSTMRARLEALEADLGVALFMRARNGAVPTPAAAALAPRARAILAQVNALASEVREGADEPAGSIHIRAPVGLPPELSALFGAEVMRRYPRVQLRSSFSDDPTAHLAEDVDLVLHFGPTMPRGPFRTSVIVRMPEHLLASRDYLERKGRPQTLADLESHTLLSWRPPGEDGCTWPTRDGRVIEVHPVLVSPDIHVVRTLARLGLGIALLPDAPVRTSAADEGLEAILVDQIERECAFRLVVPESRATLPKTRAAVRILQEIASGALSLQIEDPTA